MARPKTWFLMDHLCRHCGGRVLQCASGGGPTGGGNPIFRCADCGAGSAAMGPDCICWCGFEHRHGNGTNGYQCRRLADAKDDPALRTAFLSCGFDPDRSKLEIGIYMPDYYRLSQERIAAEAERNER